MCRRQVAQSVSHVMLDHMSSTGVMHGDGRRRGEERVKHERKKKNISAVHVWYRNKWSSQPGVREVTTSHQKSVRVTMRVTQKVVNKAAYQGEEKQRR